MQIFKQGARGPRAFRAMAVLLVAIGGGLIGMIAVYTGVSADSAADLDASLRVPDGYRTRYQYLGTWAVASDAAPGSQELHVVYAQPGTIEAYRANGAFPDGTILVKEVYHAATEDMTTGTVSHAGALRG